MKIAVTAAVLLAVVATAVVTVCQHSETRQLQYRVWKLERRRERLERDRRRLTSAIEAARTPRRLLGTSQHPACPTPGTSALRGFGPPVPAQPAPTPFAGFPEGFEPGDNFEGGQR